MRYRPFGTVGQSSSALTCALPAGMSARDADALVCAALECGINSYLLPLGDAASAEAMRGALGVVERRMLLVTFRCATPVHDVGRALETMLGASGIGQADGLLVEIRPEEALSDAELATLQALRASRRTLRLGVWGEGAVVDAQLRRLDFDVLATCYNVRSGWPERNRIKAAVQSGLSIFSFGFHVDAAKALVQEHAPKGLKRLFHKPSEAVAHAYDFLRYTPGWTAEQITLAYALTEPALASVVVETADPGQLETLAAAVERELPPSAAAQIEIARFAA